MRTENHRVDRVADSIQRLAAQVIKEEIKDPRLGMVTVSDVEVSKDLSHAKIFITVLDDDKREESLRILNAAAGFVRKQISKQLSVRSTPHLKFYFDTSISEGSRLSQLIDKAIQDDSSQT